MATINGLTAERMQEIIDKTVVDADIVAGHLILTLDDGSTVDAGNVGGVPKGNAFPAGATDGDLFVRTDQALDPLYKYTDGSWVIAGGAGVTKATAFPTVPAPTDGDLVVRTDQTGDPLYKYTDGIWELQPRMGSLTVPSVRATRLSTGTQTVSNGVAASVAFPTEDYDTDTMHDTVTNTTRITIKTPGLYRFTAYLGLDGAGTGYLSFNLNGSSVADPSPTTKLANDQDRGEVVHEMRLAAGDYVELSYQNNSGATRTIVRASLSAQWLGGAGQTVDERGVPSARMTMSTTPSIPTGVDTAVTAWDTELFDTDGMHDPSVNPGRFTCKTPGLYFVNVEIEWPSNSTGWRRIFIRKNSALDSYQVVQAANGTNTVQTATAMLMLAAGDYIDVSVSQSSGGALVIGGNAFTHFSTHLIASSKTVTPFAKAKVAATQAIPNSSTTQLAFGAESSDNDGIHDTVTNNGRLTCRTAGVYDVACQIIWPVANGGTRELYIERYNAAGVFQEQIAQTDAVFNANAAYSSCSGHAELAVGDYLIAKVWHDQGGTLTLANDARQIFSMVKIGAPNTGGVGLGPTQSDVYTVATLPAANTFPNGRIVGVSDGAAGQQARMAMNGAWLNLG